MGGADVLLGLMLGAMLTGAPADADAAVNINIGIGAPPPVVIAAPPEVVLIPDTQVYFVPDYGASIFFYSGRWYRRHNGCWYRASYYNGPWVYLARPAIPRALIQIPANYRVYARDEHIPYGQLKKRWREEERGRHGHEREHHGRHHRDDD
ncbi:MAG TPA: hypothetical protein VF790_06380 [Dissulfurispiraceae bacterium]